MEPSRRVRPAPLGNVNPGEQPGIFGSWDNSDFSGTPFDRGDPANVFRNFTFVYVPLCTFDAHAGSAVVTYRSGERSLTIHHTGHTNLETFLARVAATWPAPRRLVVMGLSGGGFGSLINYDTIRLYWPHQVAYLIDDSGPALAGVPFPGGWSPQPDAWHRWNVQAALGKICPECERDFSAIYSSLERWYPNDRKSLLSHLSDLRIEWAYGLIPVWGEADASADALYASALRRTASVLEASRWEWFYAPECGHTLVVPHDPDEACCAGDAGWPGCAGDARCAGGRCRPQPQLSCGVSVQRFLQHQVDDDPSWSPVTPPPPP